MFTLEAVKREADESSFFKGKSYYRNNRVAGFSAITTGNGKFEINAVVRGTDIYKTVLKLDTSENRLIDWHCTCPYHFGGICKHIVAAGLYFYYNKIEATTADESTETVAEIEPAPGKAPVKSIPVRDMSSGMKYAILDDLGLTSLKYRNINPHKDKLVFIFDKFNIDGSAKDGKRSGQMQAARTRRFSMKIIITGKYDEVSEVFDKAQGIRIDMGLVRDNSGGRSFLLEYVAANGVYINGLYLMGQMNIDTVFAISSGLDGIMYGRPPRMLEFTHEQFKPEIMLFERNDSSVSLTFSEEILIIPGKYSTFVLKDNKIMRLSDEIPFPFIEKMNKKLVIEPGLREMFITSVLPMIKETIEIKGFETETIKTVVNEEIVPEVNIYVEYSKDTDEVYIIPEIRYGDYLAVNPFDPAEVDDFANFYFTAPKMKVLNSIEQDNNLIQFKRDIYKEHTVYLLLTGSGNLSVDEYGRLPVSGDDSLYYMFTELIPSFPGDWKVLYDKEIERLKLGREKVSFDFDFWADADNGLLEFDLEFHCGNLKMDLDQLSDYIRNNRKILNIDGNFIEITNREELGRLFSLLERFNGKGKQKKYSGMLFNASELDTLLESSRNFTSKSNEGFRCLMQEMKSGRPLENVEIPERFSNVLRNYQKDGVHWMHFLRKYGFGGILADDMGLGKTLQALVVLFMKPAGAPSLIVCPKTLIHNWYNEIQKFVPGLKTLVINGSASERLHKLRSAGEFDLVITSYPLLQRDIAIYAEIEFEYCIIDEAQYIKNPTTRTARCVKSVKSRYRLALTGTPVENSTTDLWSIFDFVMPGFLGNEASFRAKYANTDPSESKDAFTVLNKKIKPFLLRRTKKEMLKDLPPKIEQIGFSDLTNVQLALYSKMLEKIRGELFDTVARKGFGNSQIEILTGLLRLRQICNHPGLVNNKLLDMKNISGKMELFEELIEECMNGGHKVLVFSQFVKMLEIIKAFLEKKKIRYCYLDGQSKDREDIIHTFNSDNTIRVFLISLKAGGFGLNLTSADTVVLYDPWWNPMVEEQASDRAHRIGQEKTVNVYRLITKGTVEEKIQKLQERKKQLFDSLVNESGDYFKKLSWDDLKEVLA